MSIFKKCYGCGHAPIPTNLIVKELVFNYLEGIDVDSYLSNTIISAAKAATDRANTSADVVADLVVGKVRAQDVNTADGSTQADKNTEFHSELDAQKLDTGITATSKNGTLPITQSVKNAQTISMVEYGAVGDGVTDDTVAFELLESNVTGRVIDLQGKTYLVSNAFNANDYVNGKLKQASSGIALARGDFKQKYKTSATPINIRAGLNNPKIVGDLIRSSGRGSANVVQSFLADDVNGHWYTLSAHAELGSFVNRYNSEGYINRTAIDKTDYHPLFGHQGLAMEHLSPKSPDRIWTSMGYEPTPIAGYTGVTASYTVSFVYSTSDTGQVSDYEIWKTYDLPYNGSSSPCISVDGRFLITRIQQTDADGVWRNIRVWEMSTIREMRAKGDFDISNLHIAEWRYDPANLGADPTENTGLQAIACDGNYVYMLEGANTVNPPLAYIYIFDIVGNFVDVVNINTLGHDKAVALNTDGTGLYECEGIQVVKTASGGLDLWIQFAMGIGGVRECIVYSLNGKRVLNLTNDDAGFAKSLLLGNSQGEDIHYLSTRGLKISAVNSSGVALENKLKMGSDGTVLIGEGMSTQDIYSVVNAGHGGMQNISVNSSRGSATNQIRSDNSSAGVRVQYVKSRGTTLKQSAATVKGDEIANIDFIADDGFANWDSGGGVLGARIQAKVWGTVTQNNVPTRLMFYNNAGNASGGSLRWLMETDGALLPIGGMNIGDGSNRVNDIYLSSSPIISSDERLKQDFRGLKTAEKKAALEIKESISLYKMKDSVAEKGDSARWHVGVKAQQIVSIMESHGLQPFDYGFICYDEWDAQDAEIDEDGNEAQAARGAGDKYAVRYDELAMFLLAAT